jgi:(S)-sulfolactate dehydrogenase
VRNDYRPATESRAVTARVLITEAVNAPLSDLDGLDVDERIGVWRDRAALAAALRGCAALIVRNETRVDSTLLLAADKLRVVGRLGAGLDNIDVTALRSRSIELVHGAGLNARAVAEYVLASGLVLVRGIMKSDREVRRGAWNRRVGIELRGQTLGVVGLGATGAETARLGLALGMYVVGHDPFLSAPPNVKLLDLDTVLDRSRFLTLHVPLNDSTRGLISTHAFSLLPHGAFLINASRGAVVDEAALAAALDSGQLAGAALDVRSTEPPAPEDPLAARDDVMLTAHIAGLTEQSQDAIARHVLRGVREVLVG